MPALVNRSVGSLKGIREELGTALCPLRSKYFRNASRIWWLLVNSFSCFIALQERCRDHAFQRVQDAVFRKAALMQMRDQFADSLRVGGAFAEILARVVGQNGRRIDYVPNTF